MRVYKLYRIHSLYNDYVNLNNQYLEMNSYDGKSFSTTKIYYKDNKLLSELTLKSDENSDFSSISYTDGESSVLCQSNDLYKTATVYEDVNNKIITPVNSYSWNIPDSFSNYLKLAITLNISSAKCNNIECYKIIDRNNILFINKENGLLVRKIQKAMNEDNVDSVSDYEYTFNIVSDENIKKPDLEGYEIVNK